MGFGNAGLWVDGSELRDLDGLQKRIESEVEVSPRAVWSGTAWRRG